MYRVETPLEKDLYQVSREGEEITEVQIFLKSMETVCAPFIYDGFGLPQEQIKNQVKVVWNIMYKIRVVPELFNWDFLFTSWLLAACNTGRIAVFTALNWDNSEAF